jgi:hypothetical protein
VKSLSKPAAVATAALGAWASVAAQAPAASADTDNAVPTHHFGERIELTDGAVVQGWTIDALRPSADAIDYRPEGALWEASATDVALQNSAIPVIPHLFARAPGGDEYRVLFRVASAQGLSPAPLEQGQMATGKVYFDVTGEAPDSVVYRDGDATRLTWLPAPPAPAPAVSRHTSPPPSSSAAPSQIPAPSSGMPNPTDVSSPGSPMTATATAPDAGVEAIPGLPSRQGTPVGPGWTGTPAGPGWTGTPAGPGQAGTPIGPGSTGGPEAASGGDAAPHAPGPVGNAETPASSSAPASPTPATGPAPATVTDTGPSLGVAPPVVTSTPAPVPPGR